MKAFKSKKAVKKIAIVSLLLLSAVTINANPLKNLMGTDNTGLDTLFIIAGISAIAFLVFFPGAKEKTVSTIKLVNDDLVDNHRRVIKKTA